jgi:hypothetical protein
MHSLTGAAPTPSHQHTAHPTRRPGRRALAPVMLAAAWLCAALLVASPAAAEPPLKWSAATNVDATHELSGISCPSVALCVAIDRNTADDVITTTNPTGGASAWTVTPINTDNPTGISCVLGAESSKLCVAVDCVPEAYVSPNPTGGAGEWTATPLGPATCGLGPYSTGVSCPSTSMCVAIDSVGEVVATATATGGSSAWHRVPVDSGHSLNAISCPTTSLCVAVDNVGNVVSSQSPLGGEGSWNVTNVDGTHYLRSISCVREPLLCVAGDEAGNVLTSTSPTGGPWTAAHVDGTAGVLGMSCPSATLCVGVDNQQAALMSTNPTGGATAWTREAIDPGQLLTGVSCASTTLCVATDWHGNIVEGTGASTSPPPSPSPEVTSKGASGTPPTHVIAREAQILSVTSNGEGQVTTLLSCPAVGGECGPLNVQLSAQLKVEGNKVVGVLARAKKKTHIKAVLVASTSLSLAAGQQKQVVLRLNASGRALLARFKRMTTQMRVIVGGRVLSTRTVKLVNRPKHTHKHRR